VDSIVIPRAEDRAEGDSPILRVCNIGTVPERAQHRDSPRAAKPRLPHVEQAHVERALALGCTREYAGRFT